MSRIAPPDETALTPAVRQVFAEETARYGAPLNTTKVWARHPALLDAVRGWNQAMRSAATTIPKALTYLIYVRVASLTGCPF